MVHSKASNIDLTLNSEINVTPFVDIMLVLLIVFMIAAPMSTVDIPVDLPSSDAQRIEHDDKPLYLTIQKDLTLSLNEKIIMRDNLEAELEYISKGNKDEQIFLRVDKMIYYGDLIAIIDLLRRAGYFKVALVSLDKEAR